jgi:anti-sigma B factor antagonist
MDVAHRTDGAVTVVSLDGRLDSRTAAQVHRELREVMPEHPRILLDLSRTSYLSSAGLRVLLLVHRQAQSTGSRIALAAIADDVREVMSATGFLEFFTVSDTIEHGVEALRA